MTREELTLKAIATYNGNLHSGMTKALEAVVEMVLEEAAMVTRPTHNNSCNCGECYGREQAVAAIGALKG